MRDLVEGAARAPGTLQEPPSPSQLGANTAIRVDQRNEFFDSSPDPQSSLPSQRDAESLEMPHSPFINLLAKNAPRGA
jgi:hypothetical protein